MWCTAAAKLDAQSGLSREFVQRVHFASSSNNLQSRIALKDVGMAVPKSRETHMQQDGI